MDKKTPYKTPRTRRGKNGGTLKTGNPGNKGGTGRPPDAFKAAMAELASSDEVIEHVRAVLADPSHPQWLGAWKHVTEHGYGKATQGLDVTSGGERIVVKMDFGTGSGDD